MSKAEMNYIERSRQVIKHAEQLKYDMVLPSALETSYWVFDHRITGKELNEYTGHLNNHLNTLRKSVAGVLVELARVWADAESKKQKDFEKVFKNQEEHKQFFDEIRESNETLKEQTLNLERTSQQLQDTQKVLEHALDTLQAQQEELQAHKKKLDAYQHLKHIDDIWADTKSTHERLGKTEQNVAALQKEAQTWAETTEQRLDRAEFELKQETDTARKALREDVERRFAEANQRVDDSVTTLKAEQAAALEEARQEVNALKSVAEQSVAEVAQRLARAEAELTAAKEKALGELKAERERLARRTTLFLRVTLGVGAVEAIHLTLSLVGVL